MKKRLVCCKSRPIRFIFFRVSSSKFRDVSIS